jgi:DNA adenine methylase
VTAVAKIELPEDDDGLVEGAGPFVRFVGGKTQLLPVLREWLPKRIGIYAEPFVGGGALFFDVQPRHAYLSDTNARLIRTYRAIQCNVEDVIAATQLYAVAHTAALAAGADEALYYHIRDSVKAPDVMNDVDLAAWLLYLNKTCFNGLQRVNASGKFNVPYGKRKAPLICDEARLRACSKALQRATITCRDFRETNLPSGAVAYLDPPYAPLSDTSDFTAYTAAGFSVQDQTDLRDVALRLKKNGVYVLLSNSSAPLIRDLYRAPDFEIREVQARRAVNADAAGRGAVTELLIR